MKELDSWVKSNNQSGKKMFFVQVGANDGQSKGGVNGGDDDPDPINQYVHKHGWSGVLVEPVKHIFEELKENYKTAKNIQFENSAICKGASFRDFYRIKQSNSPLPWFYDKLGTFYLDVLLKERCSIPDIENHIIEEKVQCIGFHDLLKKYGIENIDLLAIDTEGHDFEILKEVEFNRIRPCAILLEHKHISSSDFRKCRKLLLNQKYEFVHDERDIFAYCNQYSAREKG